MNLLPFNPEYFKQIFGYYSEPEYSHYNRDLDRFLSYDECMRLPQVIDSEVLFIYEDGLKGLFTFKEVSKDVLKFGIVVDKVFQRSNVGTEALKLFEEYCLKVKKCRIVMCEVLKKGLGEVLYNLGYVKGGEITKYAMVDGKLEDIDIYYKHLR